MDRSEFKGKLPGYIAAGLLAVTTTLWTFWGVGEMYYEGWWGAWYNRLPYLVPPAICVTFTLVALTWPRVGGWIVLLAGGVFTAWRWIRQAQLGALTLRWALGWFPVSGVLVVIGILFLLEGRYRRQQRGGRREPPKSWLRRNLRYVVLLTPPLLTAIGVTAFFAPLLLTRFDDGDRGARRIEGRGVTLIWAPKGPGWNWHPLQGIGRYPSWDDLALYGAPPVGIHKAHKLAEGAHATEADMEATGLCRYLGEDGTTLMPDPQGIWRMPTSDEIVRSLVRGGENAGCTLRQTSLGYARDRQGRLLRQTQGRLLRQAQGEPTSADCIRQPNKDTPLWAPDESPIYYWSADEHDEESAWYVPYTGGGLYGGVIGHQPKDWGNSRHGFRCVRAP